MQESLKDCLGAMADIIGLPSIRRVELRYPIFANMGDVARLFEHCTPHFHSLYLVDMSLRPLPPKLPAGASPTRIATPLSEEVATFPSWRDRCDADSANYKTIVSLSTQRIISTATLTSSYLRPPPPIATERLAGLKTLEALVRCRDLADVKMALTGLPPLPSLELLVLTLDLLDYLDPRDRLHHLCLIETAVEALTLSPHARIKIRVVKVTEPEDVSDVRTKILSAFAALAATGQLKIVFVD
ncbi:hypothetical protein FB451DRAFT_1563948 [Mycena latifolia]|nr:hypothetical protein FB451DRAFT_1563948 [Mycena latifolia]